MLTLTFMRRASIKPYLYLLPALLLAAAFTFLPLLKALGASFLTVSASGKVQGWAGLSNYLRLFRDTWFRRSILNTLQFALIFVPLNTALVLLASSLTRHKSSPLAEYLFSMPLAVSLASASLIFKELFKGKVNIINRIFGTACPWLESPGTAMAVLALLGVFLDFGLDYLLLLSAFRSTDRDILDAARLDGAGGLQLYFRIELPMIRSMLGVVVFMALKEALLISAPVMILTEGGPYRSTETVMYFYYLEAFKSGNRAVESTVAVLAVLASVLLMTALNLLRRNSDE